jgi:uncharacterized membrane protein YbaN (DUF454 family)
VPVSSIKAAQRYLLLGAGFLCVGLGTAGIFIPILPTTPFLLLAAACFFRSSDRLYNRLVNHNVFGSYILGFRRFRAVSVRAKVMSITALWLFIGFSAVYVAEALWLRIVLAAVAVGVSVYLLSLRTLTKEMTRLLHQNDCTGSPGLSGSV